MEPEPLIPKHGGYRKASQKGPGRVLMRFNELGQALQLRLSGELTRFTDDELQAVVGLLKGSGAVWELKYGSWVLLQPERINVYAQAVIRTLQTDELRKSTCQPTRITKERHSMKQSGFPHCSKSLTGSKLALTLIAALSLLCGCAGIPKEQLNAYVSSVGEAKQAGQTMLADWRSARAESDRRKAASEAILPGPIPMVRPPSAPGNGGLLSAEDTRVLAWEAIAEYTAVLARLNAGESVDEVKQTTGRLFGLATSIAGSVFPGADALGPILQELAGRIEQARTAAEFKKAVHKGAPIVTKIIAEVLLKDVNSHYTLRASLANEDLAHVEFENLSKEDARTKKARIMDEAKAFSDALDAYAALLSKTKLSLEALEKALDQPIDFAAEANRLLDLSFSLKQHWAAYENARKEARN